MEKYILIDSDGYLQPEYYDSIPAVVAKCDECFRTAAYNSVCTFIAVCIKDLEPVKTFMYSRYQFVHGLIPTFYE